MSQTKMIIMGVVGVIIALLFLTVSFGSWYTIDEGDVGVKLRNGSAVSVEKPGLGFKVPLVEDIKTISVRRQTYSWKDLSAYTFDRQIVSANVSITIDPKIEEAKNIYSRYTSIANMVTAIVSNRLETNLKNVFGEYTAEKVVQKRREFELEVEDALKVAFKGEPFTLVSVQIQEISFTDEYDKAIADKQRAEVQVLTARQNAQAAVAQAEGAKQAAILQAQGDAESRKLRGEAEASAIAAKGKALADNPALVQLISAEKWSGVLPTTMIPGSAVPFVNIVK